MRKICFVCLGNIVRSPLAENLFRDKAHQRGVSERYVVDSAGIGAWHIGESPDIRMRQIAASHGFEYDGRARQFRREDFDEFDLIIAMDLENYNDLMRLAESDENKNKIRLLREFDPSGSINAGVPDPYYGGIQGFEETYQIVERSVSGLLDALGAGELLF
jgi:protein-tyrosine phosphatase